MCRRRCSRRSPTPAWRSDPGRTRSRSPKTSCSCASGSTRARHSRARLGAGARPRRARGVPARPPRRWRVVKTPRGGYDGKGVRIVRSADAVDDWFAVLDEHASGSARCSPRSGWASVGSWRSRSRGAPPGELAAWPLVESVQRDGVCAEVFAPAPGAGVLVQHGRELAEAVAERLDVTGVLAVELFETEDGRLLVNELAMRPHNTGHWTIDGCRHESVRAAPARRARPPARLDRAARSVERDGQHPRWPLGGDDARPLPGGLRRSPGDQVPLLRQGVPARAGRSVTSPASATNWTTWSHGRAPRQGSSKADASASDRSEVASVRA